MVHEAMMKFLNFPLISGFQKKKMCLNDKMSAAEVCPPSTFFDSFQVKGVV